MTIAKESLFLEGFFVMLKTFLNLKEQGLPVAMLNLMAKN